MPDVAPQQTVVLLEPSDRAAFDVDRNELLALALPDEIASPQEYSAVAADQERIAKFIKRVKPEFDAVCADAHQAWKRACGLRSMFFDGLERFDARARQLLGAYQQKQDRIRREEERRLAEEERQKELARRNAEAALLKKQGQPEMAAAVKAQPVAAPAVSLPSAVPEVEGLSYREDWKWRPAGGDTPEGRAAAVNLVPREYLKLDDVKLNAMTRMKGTVKIPGIEFYTVKVPIRR